ncbi:MAG: hypothetical protein IT372_36815, partial [Polyangiaceae bacterium]|nr:hypothetical protein [Polyangiaceae bacterium]
LAAAHRQVLRLERAIAELATALHTPELERAAALRHYAAAPIYRDPGDQRAGLYPFEVRALEAYFKPPPARLLVHGAGAGREVLALLDRGYDVDAFEPVPTLAASLRRAAAERPDGGAPTASVDCEGMEEWAASPVGSYDGVIVGWGAFTHLLRRDARVAVLRAFRKVCPRGPVLLSFWRREPVFDPAERGGGAQAEGAPLPARFQAFTRGLLRARLLRLPPLEPGTSWRAGLFVHLVSEAELREEAAACGYRLAHYERDASRYPNAVLFPG